MKKCFNYLPFFVLLSVLFACNNGEKVSKDAIDNPISAQNQGDVPADKLPTMTFNEYFHDFGKVYQGEKVTYAFKFVNKGKTDLIIQSASGSCGCTVPEYPKNPIKPGEEGFIRVAFDSEGRAGMNEKMVTILANTIPNKIELKIKADVTDLPKNN